MLPPLDLLLRSAFSRLRPRVQGLSWLAGCVVSVCALVALWLLFWRVTLPAELVWVLALRLRVALLERQNKEQILAMRTRCTPAERKESLARVLSAISAIHHDDAHSSPSLDRFLSGWHFGTPISEIDTTCLQRFLCSIMFYVASLDELRREERQELDAAVAMVEAARITAGSRNDAMPDNARASMRVCMPAEPLNWLHFPLLVYTSLAAIRLSGRAAFALAGFTRYALGEVTYYRRPATNAGGDAASRLPLVLLPGVGVGVGGYFPLLVTSLSQEGSELLVVELSQVTAGRMQGRVPAEADVAASVLAMLAAHSHRQARFICHSYGTFVLAWLLGQPTGRSVVHSLLLIDPVALLIAFPHTTHGAVYRRLLEPPLTESSSSVVVGSQSRLAAALGSAELLRRLGVTLYFMREAHIALVLQRHVHWPSYSLWLQDIPARCRVTVALSTRDAIVPTREVASYVASRPGLGVKVLWLQAHEHGAVVYHAAQWGELAQALQ